ncbi:MAG: aminotransferase class IV family protein [Rhizobiaceae bacterium]|nr:aminotransferase class IV family protein [Rhizobiaceae bacterium]
MPAESTLRHGNGASYQLIETLRWEPDGGFIRGARHLERMGQSALALGFSWNAENAERALQTAIEHSPHALRVRVVLDPDGSVTCTVSPFSPLASDALWRLRIASARLDSSDLLLRHKTSRRTIYAAARSEFGITDADEVLLLNERGELCEGTITTLFVDFGDGHPLATPTLSCGLLAGVLRAEMLEKGLAQEAVIMPHEMTKAREIFVGNSLRGLVRAQLS